MRRLPAPGGGALAAVAVWLVATPLAAFTVRRFDLDPFTVAGGLMPVALGAVAGTVLVVLVLRRPSHTLVGAAAGLYAAWTALVIAAALHGTPYGYGSLTGDQGRLTAMSTKYETAWGSTDAFVDGVASEYPPLYPWLVGHVSAALGQPAWASLGEAQLLTFSGAVVVAFLLWRRLTTAPAALAIAVVGSIVLPDVSKDYEVLALVVITPWSLATFADLPREQGGLHWVTGGLLGGLLITLYPGFLLFGALGISALVVLTWTRTSNRRRYVLHLAGVTGVAFLVSSWYVLPLVAGLLGDGGNRVSDLYRSPGLVTDPVPLPFLEPTPLGAIQLAGLLGVLWYRRTTWWAMPLLLLTLGTYAYRLLWTIRMLVDGHTGFLQYTDRLVGMVLASAGVLTLVTAAPGVVRRIAVVPRREVAVSATVVLVAWTAVTGWEAWMPGPRGRDAGHTVGEPNLATRAHDEPLPGGDLPRYAPAGARERPYPVSGVERIVEARLGTGARPVTLAQDQRLFAFLPWYGYIAPTRGSANTLQKWDQRRAELSRLARIEDPGAFARASADTAFGGIDVFVLRREGGAWKWRELRFSPSAFGEAWFDVVELPGSTVVAVRR